MLRRIISLLLFLVIAGWLSQADFGIFRSFSLILLLLSTAATFGLDLHYISSQKRGLLNLLSLIQSGIMLSLGLGVLCTVFAISLGKLYHSPELGRLLLFSLPVLGIEVLRLVNRAWAQKQLKFRELALAETLNVLLYSALAILGIFFIREVWLYLTIYYLGNLAEALCLWKLLPPLPDSIRRRVFSKQALRNSLAVVKVNAAFLANVNSINIIQVYAGNAPILFLGMLAAPEQMGLYFFATQLIGVPVGMLTGSLSQVFFPVFALQEKTLVISNIKRYTALVLGLGLPLLIGYAFGLQYIIPFLLGDKWNAALTLIYYLLLFYGSSLLHHPISGIPILCRKPEWELIWNVVSFLLRIGALAWGIRFGYNFAVLLFCIVSALLHLGFYLMALVLLRINLLSAILNLLPRLLIPGALAALLLLMNRLQGGLLFGSALLLLYFAATFFIRPDLWQDLKKLLLPA